jgi:hypothetical protein
MAENGGETDSSLKRAGRGDEDARQRLLERYCGRLTSSGMSCPASRAATSNIRTRPECVECARVVKWENDWFDHILKELVRGADMARSS